METQRTEKTQGISTIGADVDAIVIPILSKWVVEKGRWDKTTISYVDRTIEEFERTIKMRKEMRNGKQVLVFIGGPTGHESYYIEDLILTGEHSNSFCICGGTINSWPACYVDSSEVFNFIKDSINE